ncbi:MAG: diguanylate cyclase domain-containing protein [Kineosporiaceae bacterium]
MEPAAQEPGEDDLVHADALAVARRSLLTAVPAIVIGAVLYITTVALPPPPGPTAAFAALTLGMNAATVIALTVVSRRTTRRRLRIQHALIIVMSLVFGTTWGCAPLLFDLGADQDDWLYTALFIIAICGLNAVGYSTLRGAAEALNVPMCLVFAPQAVLSGVPFGWSVGIGCLVFVGLCVTYGAINRRQAHEAFRLRHRNEALARRLAASEVELAYRATHDSLTGLLNRAGVLPRLDRLPAHPASAILLVDLDGFKDVNDTHGHAAGDAVLVAVADRLTRAVRDGDDVARLGGDEFVVALPAVGDPAGRPVVDRVVRRLVTELAAPIPVEGGMVAVGASVGVAWTSRATGSRNLLAAADAAMYRTKAERRAGRAVDQPVS